MRTYLYLLLITSGYKSMQNNSGIGVITFVRSVGWGLCVCVHACAYACVHACVCMLAYVHACMRVWVCVYMCACVSWCCLATAWLISPCIVL